MFIISQFYYSITRDIIRAHINAPALIHSHGRRTQATRKLMKNTAVVNPGRALSKSKQAIGHHFCYIPTIHVLNMITVKAIDAIQNLRIGRHSDGARMSKTLKRNWFQNLSSTWIGCDAKYTAFWVL
jgi:hypothetical protein